MMVEMVRGVTHTILAKSEDEKFTKALEEFCKLYDVILWETDKPVVIDMAKASELLKK